MSFSGFMRFHLTLNAYTYMRSSQLNMVQKQAEEKENARMLNMP